MPPLPPAGPTRAEAPAASPPDGVSNIHFEMSRKNFSNTVEFHIRMDWQCWAGTGTVGTRMRSKLFSGDSFFMDNLIDYFTTSIYFLGYVNVYVYNRCSFFGLLLVLIPKKQDQPWCPVSRGRLRRAFIGEFLVSTGQIFQSESLIFANFPRKVFS